MLFKGFSLNEIINELRIPGNRKTINFSFNSFSTLNELASRLVKQVLIRQDLLKQFIHSIMIQFLIEKLT